MRFIFRLCEILRKSREYFKLCCGRNRVRIRSARGGYIKTNRCLGLSCRKLGSSVGCKNELCQKKLSQKKLCHGSCTKENGFKLDLRGNLQSTMSVFFTGCKEMPCFYGLGPALESVYLLDNYSNTSGYDFLNAKACNLLNKHLTAGRAA